MTVSAGIVATVREPVWIVESFLRYHLQRGFSHIFLFFDDPLDPAIEVARRFENVTAIPCDAEILDRQRRCQCFPIVGQFQQEIMARQILNAEIGLELAAQIGLDWLLHIDGDELFYTSGNVSEHFEFVPSSVGRVSYLNFEAIPETWETQDYFREVTLFKKHEHLLRPGAADKYRRSLKRTIYLLGYGNGKSATRVLPGVLPNGVHLFTPTPSHPDQITCSGGPVILHYINCGFNSYCHKYERLGSDRWLGVPIPFDFYLQSRQLTGNLAGLTDLYRREVLVEDQAAVEDLIAQGTLLRITTPSRVLRASYRAMPSKAAASTPGVVPARRNGSSGVTTVIRTDEVTGPPSHVPGQSNAARGGDVASRMDQSTSTGRLAVRPSHERETVWEDRPTWDALRAQHPWPAERPPVVPQREHGWLRPSTGELLARHLSAKTELAVELGSWLGLSTRFILNAAPTAAVIAIDHWRGSAEHYHMPDAAQLLPHLFETFQVNCWESRDRLLPLRMSSLEGLKLIAERGLRPDLIYIDADHGYEPVKADLEACLDLFPEATLVGDDWDWDGVRQAVEDVSRARNIPVEVHGVAWTISSASTP